MKTVSGFLRTSYSLGLSKSNQFFLIQPSIFPHTKRGVNTRFYLARNGTIIRAHFFQRCQIKAGAIDNPGLKHNLLRLGRRKLKEIDEDMQRHNNLLEVVRAGPSYVKEVTVLESYDEDPTKQAG
ncbi:hypothetical protein MKW98_022565 [Papaver atlanticum]|uniref:Uncharacterized protein n=1 Tax=Papaver atlanticum TaxID=357466 RepID=A0AAD4SLJ5_9MAGN|nr:hypothetical protein MKW98_022565 [Papaver atlanticum]